MASDKVKSPLLKHFVFLKFRAHAHPENPAYKEAFISYRRYAKRFVPLLDSEIMIALTYRCQCKCVHCGSALHEKDKEKELKDSEIIGLIDEAGKLGSSAIYFFGGEPLLISGLSGYVKHAKQRGMRVTLDTNGFLLNEDKVRELKASGVDGIRVSIDSADETTHDKLRGMKGIFKRAVGGIKYCKKHNMKCAISTYATKENLKNGELVKMINLAKGLNVKIRILSTICSGKWSGRADLFLSPEEITLLKGLLEKNVAYWEAESLDTKETTFFCTALDEKGFFYVSAYGDIQPCCYLPVCFGNIREEPLENIVKRMYSSDMFASNKKHNDCPANDQDFRKRYGK